MVVTRPGMRKNFVHRTDKPSMAACIKRSRSWIGREMAEAWADIRALKHCFYISFVYICSLRQGVRGLVYLLKKSVVKKN